MEYISVHRTSQKDGKFSQSYLMQEIWGLCQIACYVNKLYTLENVVLTLSFKIRIFKHRTVATDLQINGKDDQLYNLSIVTEQ